MSSQQSLQSFPRELLKQPPGMRLDYFRKLTISHPLLLRAYEDVRCAIRDCEPGSVILVQGPAGVGKTTLLCRFEKDFREQSLPDLTNDVGRLPVVRINAIAPDRSKFDWKDYFRRLLVALGEPESLINSKIIQNQSEISIVPTSIVVLRHAIDQALSYRGTLAVLVDDIQHMGSGYKLHDQISILKTKEILPLIRRETKPIAYLNNTSKHLHALNGSGSASPRWVSAMESLTCQNDLQLLTMLRWRNMLASKSLLRQTRVWCSDCFADSKDNHEPIYEKLVWTLIPVSVCILHPQTNAEEANSAPDLAGCGQFMELPQS